MSHELASQLTGKKCVPCEGGVQPLSLEMVQSYLKAIPQWRLTANGKGIERSWKAKHFMAAMDFLNRIAAIAEEEDHHPDIHLTGYRQIKIEMTTHSLNGLSENDFILAAKIDQIPIELKQ